MIEGRAQELRGQRAAFVSATVVRAEKPTSAKPGDSAIVLADGTIEGFVGGVCAETSVRATALNCLSSSTSVLLRIVPSGVDATADPVGVNTVENPCLSGGTLEIFMEPVVPPALVYVIGSGPTALALGRGGSSFGFDIRVLDTLPEPLPDDTAAIIVASHGRGEEQALTLALQADVTYVGLVASRRRAQAVLDGLDLCTGHTSRVHAPAGLDLGAQTPEEIALSILAQIVDERPRPARDTSSAADASNGPAAATMAVDPVCGMKVAAVSASYNVEHTGTSVYFCGPGCVDAFRANPAAYPLSS